MESKPKLVLIVEGDPIQRELMAAAVRRMGGSVLKASDGVEGADLLVTEEPDAAVIDLFLPTRSGLDILREARRLGCLERTRVIVFSALGYPEVVKQAVELGARDFLVKPVDPDLLVERLTGLLK